MAWDDDVPLILREVLQDYATTPLYTDDRLSTSFLVALPVLSFQVPFAKTYVISLTNGSITPDPTVTPRDNALITLGCLLAAKNIMGGELRDLTRQGITIQDDTSKISLQRNAQAMKLMYEKYEKMYDDALYAFKTGGSDGLGLAISGPYKYLWDQDWGMGSMYDGYPSGGRSTRGAGGVY